MDEKPDSNNFYHEVFNENFSLGFSPSSADTCNYYDRTQELKGLEKKADKIRKLKVEKAVHKRRAKVPHEWVREYRAKVDDTIAGHNETS